MVNSKNHLRSAIRNIRDFPKQGIVFRDITTLLKDPLAYRMAVDLMVERAKALDPTKIISVESRGFIFGSTIAYKLGIGFVPVRKPGKLPAPTIREQYVLEYGTDALEIHVDALSDDDRVLVVDDLLATGGTAKAVCKLVERLGSKVAGALFLVELTFLGGRESLNPYKVISILSYETEG